MSNAGVPIAEATAKDFMQVRAALVRRVGGANEALVWTRIDWRLESRDAHQVGDGRHWWAATYPELAEETGLTPEQVRRAVERLIQGGYLLAEQHHGFSRTRSYSTVTTHLADSPDGEIASSKRRGRQMDLADSPDAPLYRDVREEKKTSEVADATLRTDIDALLDLLDEQIELNGGRKPARTKKNRDAARLLLTRDGKTVEQVAAAIRWAQADEFWRSNILSMSKLREKYDTLRLQAARGSRLTAVDTGRAADAILSAADAPRLRALS